MVAPADSTLSMIKRMVRKQTGSSNIYTLSEADLEQYINTAYTIDFPYAIKLDQTRIAYSFFTSPNVDRYPLDINKYQGVRQFANVEGYGPVSLFKERTPFYALWPNLPQLTQITVSESGSISAATQANPCQITSATHGLTTGNIIYITGVEGMVELNDIYYTITVVDANNFTLDSIDSTLFVAYAGGGTWQTSPTALSFTLAQKPIVPTTVVMGGINSSNNPIKITDDGGRGTTTGSLMFLTSNDVGDLTPPLPVTSPIPSTAPTNTIGTINYVTGDVIISTLPSGLLPGSTLSIWNSQYSAARPLSILFFNNEFIIRPIPNAVYKVEVEVYQTPTQFMANTSSPLLNQWAQYIALLASKMILRDRQDTDGMATLEPLLKEQEARVLERQGTEEIGVANRTIYNSPQSYNYGILGNWWGG